jgi:hypothetical protein
MLSLYEKVAARTGQYQARNTTGVSSNEQVGVTERYFQDDNEMFIKYD